MALGIKTIDQAQTAFLHHRAGTLDDDVFEGRIGSFQTFVEEGGLSQPSMGIVDNEFSFGHRPARMLASRT